MNDIVPVPLVWIRSVAFAAALAIVGVFLLGRSCAPDPAALPARTQARVTEYHVRSTIDSSGIRTQRALERKDSVTAAAARIQIAAGAVKIRELRAAADTLAMMAVHAADSATAWHAAYDARSLEADSLRSAGVQKDSVITITMHGWRAADSAFAIQAGQLARSDTLIAELLPLAQRRDHCSILFGTIKCPTRKQAFVGGVITFFAAAAVARQVR